MSKRFPKLFLNRNFLTKKSLAKSCLAVFILAASVFAIVNPKVQASSIRGLEAKLETVELQISKGNTRAALRILEGFYRQINALQSAGKIDLETYNDLYDEYSTLIDELGETPTPPSVWEVQYDGSVLPNEATPSWAENKNKNPTIEIVDGSLHIMAHGLTNSIWYNRYTTELPSSTGWTMEARIKVIKDGGGAPTDYFCYFDGTDDANYSLVTLRKTDVSLDMDGVGTPVTYAMDTTDDFHTYRLTVQGGKATLYVDGAKRLEKTGPGSSYTQTISFCDSQMGPLGSSDIEHFWDYLYYDTRGAYAPEEFPQKHHPGLLRIITGFLY